MQLINDLRSWFRNESRGGSSESAILKVYLEKNNPYSKERLKELRILLKKHGIKLGRTLSFELVAQHSTAHGAGGLLVFGTRNDATVVRSSHICAVSARFICGKNCRH